MDTRSATDTDSDADRNDVLQILLEQEPSTPQLVQKVFSQVQAEFTSWNDAYCQRALTSFTPPSAWQSRLHPDFRLPSFKASMTTTPRSLSVTVPEVSCSSQLVSQETYSLDGTLDGISTFELNIVHVSLPLEPHPAYESCPPLHRNAFKGDDADNMDFIPYADDHTFEQASHLRHYGSLSWQHSFDPDLEVIVLEAVHRLRLQYALTYDEIEDCNVLPLALHSRPGKPGLLATARRRDQLDWTGNTTPLSYSFFSPTRSKGSDFRNHLRTLNLLFCPNLNCVEPFCSVHAEPNPMPLEPRPSLSRDLAVAARPCRNQCFMNGKIKAASPRWNEADLDMFKVISEISPNATPCDLAELCLKPCCEVFYYGNSLCPSNSENDRLSSTRNRCRTHKFNDMDPSQFTPNEPCHHPGPCSGSTCSCFKNHSHCHRSCNCSLRCNRRWQGCRCPKTRSRVSCVAEKCPCIEASRECDPELCTNCRCTRRHTLSQFPDLAWSSQGLKLLACKRDLAHAQQRLEVRKSDWGLGAFLTKEAKAGDLLTEYVGELIYEPTVESRADLAAHRNRCYVFGLNNTFSVDATYAGNISRFIDHADAGSKRINSKALVRLVNGDHRIGIFATRDIEAGSQVLMDYGSLFFSD